MNGFEALLASFWATLWLHAVCLFGIVWLADRCGLLRDPARRQTAWRVVVFAPLVSASLAALDLRPIELADWQLPQRKAVSVPHAVATMRTDPTPVRLVGHAPERAVDQRPMTAGVAGDDSTTRAAGRAPGDLLADSTARPISGRDDVLSIGGSATRVAWFWIAASLLLVLDILRRWRNERRRMRALPRHTDPRLNAQLRALPDPVAARTELREDVEAASPCANAPATICLPAWMPDRLDAEQSRAVLAHELAHLRRRDPQWQLATALAGCFLPWPIASTARRRLEEVAELECDAWAARATGTPRALAQSLVRCAEHLHRGKTASRFATPMANRRSALVERVRRLVEENTMTIERRSGPRRIALLGALLATALALPGFAVEPPEPPTPPEPPQAPEVEPIAPAAPTAPVAPTAPAAPVPPTPPTPPDDVQSGEVSVSRTDWFFGESTKIVLSNDERLFRFEADGEFEFNAQETDLAQLDDEVTIEETRGGTKRRMEFENQGGTIQRRYFVDGAERPLDDAARAWLASSVKHVIREAAIDVKDRSARIFQQGGASALLAEIEQIHNDYARGAYIRALFGFDRVDAASIKRAVELVRSIESDYEQRRALVAALKHDAIDADAGVTVLQMGAGFDSDYERRLLLQTAARELPGSPQVHAAWVDALRKGDSSYETRLAVQALFEHQTPDAESLNKALSLVGEIDSDYERRLALQAASEHVVRTPQAADAYFDAVASMGSSYEARLAMQSLVKQGPLDARTAAAAISTASKIESDYECRLALVSIVENMPNQPDLVERARDAAREISDHERGQVEKALDRLRS